MLCGDASTPVPITVNGFIGWNLNELTLFVRSTMETAPEGSYFGKEGTISAKAKGFNWNESIRDLSKDDPTLK